MLYCVEVVWQFLNDLEILSDDLIWEGQWQEEGVGVVEVLWGMLMYYYWVDEKGKVIWCNFIVFIIYNNEFMNWAVCEVARWEFSY